VLNVLAENGLWVATLGTGVLTAVLVAHEQYADGAGRSAIH
jgi:hypothetical protein